MTCRTRAPGLIGALRLLLFLLLPLAPDAPAASLVAGPDVDLSATNTAIIRWSTDVPTRGRLRWGPAPGPLRRELSDAVTNVHVLRLEGLQAGRRYDFVLGSARQDLATNHFVTGPSDGTPGPPATGGPTVTNLPGAPGPSVPGGEATGPRAPPTRETWGSLATLPDHFARHGSDFRARNADDYARMAWEFRERARRERLLMKLDDVGVLRIYDPRTRAFGAYNRDGKTRTFFKPQSRDYFDRQPGRSVTSPPSFRP